MTPSAKGEDRLKVYMNISCPICSSKQSGFVEKCRDYTMYHCATCDVVFADPMKAGQDVYECADYYIMRDNLVVDPLQWEFRWDMLQFFHKPPCKGGNLLDIGCGTGFFVKRACDMGFNGYGIDFSEKAIVKGREDFGLDTLELLDLQGLKEHFPELRFHLITMFHVIEHLENPNRLMSEIRDIVTPDATIVIALPLRGRWPDTLGDMDEPPHHLTRWSLKSMESFLERNGYYIKHSKIESFSLQNMQALIYPFVLKFFPRLTIKGSSIDLASGDINCENALKMLKKMKAKKTMSNILGIPLWTVLRLLGAQGPNLYIEAAVKP